MPLQHSDITRNIRKKFKLSQKKFSDYIGIKLDTINSIENSRSSITPEIAEIIISKFPELKLSVNDILSGDIEQQLDLVKAEDISKSNIYVDNCVNISFITTNSEGEILTQEDHTYPVPLKDIIHLDIDIEDLALFRVIGHAMSTLINEADILVISKKDTKPKDGEIYVIKHDGELYCKRVLDNVTEYILESENIKYRPVYISERNKLEVIGKVVYRMNRF